MKIAHVLTLALPIILSLSGCTSPPWKSGEEFILPQMQQNTYLSHTTPPQQFGYSVYPTEDGAAFQGSGRLHPNHLASPGFLKGTIPVIEMRGRSARNTMNVLLDVSSPSSWMEFSTSQEFGAIFLGWKAEVFPYRGGYNTGGANAYAGVIRQLRINQLFMENTPFYIRMATGSIGPLGRGIRVPPIDAVLGWDNLSNFAYIQFDLKNRYVQFSSSRPYRPHDDLLMTKAKIIQLRNYGLAIEGAIFGEATPILLDFAGNFHFARGDIKVSSTKQVSLGDVVYRKVPTLLLPIHNSPPRAGSRMMESYIITICTHEGVVYFERHPE
jgi:hypothetical protein